MVSGDGAGCGNVAGGASREGDWIDAIGLGVGVLSRGRTGGVDPSFLWMAAVVSDRGIAGAAGVVDTEERAGAVDVGSVGAAAGGRAVPADILTAIAAVHIGGDYDFE